MSTPAQRLAAPGTTLVLADGSTLQVRFDFWALHKLEEDFGSLQYPILLLNGASASVPMFTDAARIILATLDGKTYDRITPGEHNTQTLENVPWDLKGVMSVLDPREIKTYITQLGDAMREALPEPDPKDVGQGEAEAATGGEAGTTPPPSPSDAATGTSGA